MSRRAHPHAPTLVLTNPVKTSSGVDNMRPGNIPRMPGTRRQERTYRLIRYRVRMDDGAGRDSRSVAPYSRYRGFYHATP
ncbi:hypothetical protein BDQ17DRAFT_1380540 [Cyathus striatus]|nr:hypothetical protein BDQ17DRAFT_1380540 [Cyathus striatus]